MMITPDASQPPQPSRQRLRMIVILGLLVVASLAGGIMGWTRSSHPVTAVPSRWPQSTPQMRLPGRLRVLFLGNSLTAYNGGLALILEQLSKSADTQPPSVFDQVTRYGATWEVLCTKTRATEIIDQGHWDYVVLQDYSTAATEYRDEMDEYGRILSEEIHAIGARPIFFMTWPNQDKLKSTLKIAGAYINVAAANHGVVAPVGLAWKTVLRERPKLVLYDPRDHPPKHPTPAGSYLTACVFYSVLYHESPHGLTSRIVEGNNVYINLKPDVATYLQDVAWNTVRNAGQMASTQPALRPSANGPTPVTLPNQGGLQW